MHLPRELLFPLLPFSSQQTYGPASRATLTHTHTVSLSPPHTKFTYTHSPTHIVQSHIHTIHIYTHTHTVSLSPPHTKFTCTYSLSHTHSSHSLTHTHSLTQRISDPCPRSLECREASRQDGGGVDTNQDQRAQSSPGRDEGRTCLSPFLFANTISPTGSVPEVLSAKGNNVRVSPIPSLGVPQRQKGLAEPAGDPSTHTSCCSRRPQTQARRTLPRTAWLPLSKKPRLSSGAVGTPWWSSLGCSLNPLPVLVQTSSAPSSRQPDSRTTNVHTSSP